MSTSSAIQALATTNSNALFYTLGATFNRDCAAHVFAFSCMSNWKDVLTQDPLALFYLWQELAEAPLKIDSRAERSKLLAFALWECVIEKDAFYPCLVTDSKGMVKMGYWAAHDELFHCLNSTFNPVGNVLNEQDAIEILKSHRRTLFGKYFSPADVDFIMNTIPCTTAIK